DQKQLGRDRERLKVLNDQIAARQQAIGVVATKQVGLDVAKEAADDAAQDKKDEQREMQHQTKIMAVKLEAMKALGKMTADQEKYQLDRVLETEKKEDEAEAEHDKKRKERLA